MKHRCSYCQKLFSTERLLRDHIRAHINVQQCPFCEMTATSAHNLRHHIRYKHSDDRQFPCQFCKFRAKSANDLTSHMRRHGDAAETVPDEEELCAYDDCDFRTTNRQKMKFHVAQTHNKEGSRYCCHFCDARFLRGHYLTKHLSRRHNYRPPSGHSRLKYKLDDDGLYRVQTLRFEGRFLEEGDGAGQLVVEEVQEDEDEEAVDDVQVMEEV